MRVTNEMLDSVILSIKPMYRELIFSGVKKYEYRNFFPKKLSSYFLVYECSPSKLLRYMLKVKKPIEFPTVIQDESYGSDRFNTGEMMCKYAYEIEAVYTIEEPISYEFLKQHLNFIAPQSYTYLQNNKKLVEYIKKKVKFKKVL